jgi:hypothetical protein
MKAIKVEFTPNQLKKLSNKRSERLTIKPKQYGHGMPVMIPVGDYNKLIKNMATHTPRSKKPKKSKGAVVEVFPASGEGFFSNLAKAVIPRTGIKVIDGGVDYLLDEGEKEAGKAITHVGKSAWKKLTGGSISNVGEQRGGSISNLGTHHSQGGAIKKRANFAAR